MTLGIPKPPSRAAEKKAERRVSDRRWQLVRAVVLARDHFRCRHCQSPFMVDAHHIKFRSAGGKDIPSNLAALCRPCHDEIHAYRLAVSGDANESLWFEVLK